MKTEKETVKNKLGDVLFWIAVVDFMDDDLREYLHTKLSPCTNQYFFEEYCIAHMGKFGTAFELTKRNPGW